MNIRRSLATVGAAGLLAAGSLGVASPAQAAPVFAGGLVNVTLVDVVDVGDVTVQVPIAIAANICDVTVAVLAQDLRDGRATCNASASSFATR